VKPDLPDHEARLVPRVLLERLDLKASAGPVGLRGPLVIRAKPDLLALRDLLELPARRVSKGPRDRQGLLVRRVSPDRQGLLGLLGLPDPLTSWASGTSGKCCATCCATAALVFPSRTRLSCWRTTSVKALASARDPPALPGWQ
jgi:hypothetical protein